MSYFKPRALAII